MAPLTEIHAQTTRRSELNVWTSATKGNAFLKSTQHDVDVFDIAQALPMETEDVAKRRRLKCNDVTSNIRRLGAS